MQLRYQMEARLYCVNLDKDGVGPKEGSLVVGDKQLKCRMRLGAGE